MDIAAVPLIVELFDAAKLLPYFILFFNDIPQVSDRSPNDFVCFTGFPPYTLQ